MLDVSPLHRAYETLPNLNDIEIPALAPVPGAESLVEGSDAAALVAHFGDRILAAGTQYGVDVVHVGSADLLAVAEFVRNDPSMAYEGMIDVSSLDRSKLPIGKEDARYQTVYQLRSYSRKKHLTIVCSLDNPTGNNDPIVPTLANLYEGANWPEREVWDLMGVRFDGHPDHRRILMPENWPYHPLRKNIPQGGEEVPFSLTFDDPQFATLGKQILPSESAEPAVPPGFSRQNMIINMGPHHPSTHGVLRLVVELDGEDVLDVDSDLGFLHSGFEKTGENKRYKDFVYYTDRMDYLSGMNNNLGYVLTIEKLLGIEIPKRATVIRVIMSELQRIASHLFWLSTGTMDMSGMGFAVLSYATRERERILDLFEMVCGARLTVSYMRIGGVWRDLPAAFLSHVDEFIRRFPGFIDDYEKMVTESAVFKARTIGIGTLTGAQVMDMGLTGPMLRGSGVDWDLRRDMPYLNYPEYDFKVPVFNEGDGYARYLVRMEEMRQSVRIIEQAMKNLPDGLFRTDDRKVSPPPRAELDVSMEALIHHFKLWTEGLRVPPGMTYFGIEASKGELGYFVYSDGSGVPYRLHVRGPSFNNMYAIRAMSKGHMLSDVVTNIASIDPVLGEVDR